MAETNQKSTNKYHGMKPFSENRLKWGEDALQKKCRLTLKSALGNDHLFDTKLLVLESNKKPEMYILWLKEYNENVYSQDDLLGQSKYNTLLELVKDNP